MTSDRRPTRRTFLIPSIPDLVFVGLACLQVAAASMILLNRDGDLPRHIAVGKVMLDSGGLMREDFFSHTAYGQPFLAYEWLSQLIFATVYEFAVSSASVSCFSRPVRRVFESNAAISSLASCWRFRSFRIASPD